ncbi:hypothetical protein scyTo_0022431, partial [Scyliorhinus torazame]|nr:hypothetical protein [Scyliorhinus torazame]
LLFEALLANVMSNCSNSLPSSEDQMKGLTNAAIAFMVILNIVAVATYAIFFELWTYLHHNIVNDLIREKTVLVLGLFPLVLRINDEQIPKCQEQSL